MKRHLIYLASAALIFTTACNKQELQQKEETPIQPGTLTTMNISLDFANSEPFSKAVSQTTEEQKLTNAKAYIFNDLGTMEAVADFEVAQKKATATVTTGQKSVYVLANLDSYDAKFKVGYSETQFMKDVLEIQDITAIAQRTTGGTEDFSMSGHSTVNLQEQGSSVQVNLIRLAAKIAAKSSAITADPDAAGTLTDITYKAMNIAKKMYYFSYPSSAWSTPLYESTEAANYVSTAAGDQTFSANPVYVSENKVKDPQLGNTTYIIVKGKFTPNQTVDANGSNPQAGTKGTTFYRIRTKATGVFDALYYRVKPTDPGQEKEIVEYTNGISYYRVYITGKQDATSLSERYAIPRNTLINVNITHANGAGSNTEGGVIPGGGDGGGEPTDPIGKTAELTVNVTVTDWTTVDQSTGVGDL